MTPLNDDEWCGIHIQTERHMNHVPGGRSPHDKNTLDKEGETINHLCQVAR